MTKEEIIICNMYLEEMGKDKDCNEYKLLMQMLEQQPNEDCVSRQAVLDKIKEVCFSKEWAQFRINKGRNGERDFLIDYIEQLPPVTPTQRWIPIERRDLTQEEKELYSSFYGEEPEYMIESRMPDDGEEVLVSAGGIVFKDFFSHHDFDFENISVDEIDAWMPLPQPYEKKRGAENG